MLEWEKPGEACGTQRVGDARLHTGHPHVADPVLVFGFDEHSKFNVPQGLNSDLQQEEAEGDAHFVNLSQIWTTRF